MGRLFGTDGIRGVANRDLNVAVASRIGMALAMILREKLFRAPCVFIGKDTRISSDMLEAALAAGLCAGGASVVSIGVLPTPAVAFLTAAHKMDGGIMITASHNPYPYNGIKIFGAQGYKLTDEEECRIEEIVLDQSGSFECVDAEQIGRHTLREDLREQYIKHISTAAEQGLAGMRVLVDCANGSASATARRLFAGLGAQADIIFDKPDGVNINEGCGSTQAAKLCERVQEGGYALGIAFDGDADRCLAIDECGRLVDGDQIIAILANDMKQRGILSGNTAVVTVMSNLGFFNCMKQLGIHTRTTKVGDRYVLEEMRKEGHSIGGEQSGHVIRSDYMTTGDGQLTAVCLMDVMHRTGSTLSELCKMITILPQVLVNTPATPEMKAKLARSAAVNEIIRAYEKQLGERGRILIRPSGTEPLIRVMVEGEDTEEITAVANGIAEAIRSNLGMEALTNGKERQNLCVQL